MSQTFFIFILYKGNMKKIQVMPKYSFDKNINNEKIKAHNDVAFISILDKDNYEKKYDTNQSNFLQVYMWDIEEDLYELKDEYGFSHTSDALNGTLLYEKPEDTELQKIVDFANKNKEAKSFFVHCSAGISRSGAVGRYLAFKYNEEIDHKEFHKMNPNILPNLYIYNRLLALDKTINENY